MSTVKILSSGGLTELAEQQTSETRNLFFESPTTPSLNSISTTPTNVFVDCGFVLFYALSSQAASLLHSLACHGYQFAVGLVFFGKAAFKLPPLPFDVAPCHVGCKQYNAVSQKDVFAQTIDIAIAVVVALLAKC